MRKMRLVLVTIGLFYCWLAFAAVSPVDMLRVTSESAISQLKANQMTLRSNPTVVYRIINKILLPHIDVQTMSRVALGREAWLKATPQQREQFIKEFTTLMTRTYASALAAYTDETVKFMPLRETPDSNRTQVDSQIIRDDGPTIAVSYRLVLKGDDWKVYDISVEGVSMLESFRSQFADELAKGDMQHLLQTLSQHNKEIA